MNLSNNDAALEFETLFLLELIQMCLNNNFQKEAAVLQNVLVKIKNLEIEYKGRIQIVH